MRLVLRYSPIVLLCAVIAGAVGYVVAKQRVTYTVSSVMAVSSGTAGEQLIGGGDGQSAGGAGGDAAVTQVPVLLSNFVLRSADAMLVRDHGHGLASVGAEANAETGTITVTAEGDDAGKAARSVNALTAAYRIERKASRKRLLDKAAKSFEAEIRTLSRRLQVLRRRSARRLGAARREEVTGELKTTSDRYQAVLAQRQDILARSTVAGSGASVLSEATPAAAVPSGTRKLGLLAALVGMGFAGLLCLLRERARQVLRRPDDLEAAAALPVVADIPRLGRRARRRFPVTAPTAVEAFRKARVNLRLLESPDAPVRSILVTSAGSDEGKTFVTAHLARSFADAGSRVLVLSTDFRRPQIEPLLLDAAREDGLANLLRAASPDDLGAALRPSIVPASYAGIEVLPAGENAESAIDLLGDDRVADVVAWATRNYDVVLLDSPPVGDFSDAVVLSRLVDVTVLTGTVDRTTAAKLQGAKEQLEQAVLGSPTHRLVALVNRAPSVGAPRGYVTASSAEGARTLDPTSR